MTNRLRSRPNVSAIAQRAIKTSWESPHNRLVALGFLTIGVAYLPSRLWEILSKSVQGSSVLLIFVAVAFGGYQLWRSRLAIGQLAANEEDRWLGHVLIAIGVAMMPFGLGVSWLMPMASAVILVGIACSRWGLPFFRRYWVAVSLVGLGLMPNPGVLARAIVAVLIPAKWLEGVTAQMGVWILWAIHQPAQINGAMISLAGGVVEVNWGCTPFNLSTQVALAGLLAGLFMKLDRRKTALMMAIGVGICFALNMPRIAVLAMAKAYWGDWWFVFWHEGWGGQIFSMTVFTIYYYVVMAMLKSEKKVNPIGLD
jgi:exosortase/archaeosortase family protein